MPLDRTKQAAWLDAPTLSESEYRLAVRGQCRLNRVSRLGDQLFQLIEKHARRAPERTLRVLDVASGPGDLPLRWAVNARRNGWSLQITAIDANPRAIQEQQRRAEELDVVIRSLQLDCLHSPLPCGFDLVVCSLFMHQLEQPQVFRLLQSMQAATSDAIIVCDFHRSRTNCVLMNISSRLLSRSAVLRHDSVAGVRSAYTRLEFQQIAENALARPVKTQSLVPYCFLMIADEKVVPVAEFAFA